MAVTTIEDILKALETRLETIPGLRASDIVPGQINPPQAIVGVPEITSYRETMGRGYWTIRPTVTVFVSAGVDRAGQLKLAKYASVSGSESIPVILESDQTLGGVAKTVVVESFRPLGFEEYGELGYYGGVFTVKITVSGKE